MTLEEVNKKYDEFQRLLLKTPLEKHTQPLWEAFQAVASGDIKVEHRIKEIEAAIKKCYDDALSVAKPLLAILNHEPVKAGKEHITNEQALEALKQALVAEYKRMKLDYRDMTIEEAQAFLQGWKNDKNIERWIVEYKEDMMLNIDFDESFLLDDVIDDWLEENPSIYEDFASGCEVKAEITPQQVTDTIRRNSIKRKQGRRIKNKELLWLIVVIRSYYKGHCNKDYRMFFDCMDLFGLIDENVKKAWNKKDEKELNAAKTQYLKSMYDQATKYDKGTMPILIAKDIHTGKEFMEQGLPY